MTERSKVTPTTDERADARGRGDELARTEATLREREAELLEQRELLATVVAGAPIILFALDREGNFTLADGSGLADLGEQPGRAVGTSALERHAGQPVLLNDIRRALAGERFRCVRQMGGRLYETWWSPMVQTGGAIGVSLDITDLRRAEQEREQATERVRFQAELLDAVGQAVIATDLLERVIYWNRAAQVLYGWTADEAMGRDIASLISARSEGTTEAEVVGQLRDGDVFHGELLLERKDGSRFPGLVTTVPLTDARGEVVGSVSVSSDITKQKAMEMELRQAQKMEAIGRLAGGVAHDFNNLLTVIQGHVDLALGEARNHTALAVDLQEVQWAAERAAALTRQLLAFGRKQLLQERIIDLSAEVERILGMLHRLIPETVTVEVTTPDEPVRILADPTQIQQVVLNLAVNASDAMQNEGRLEIGLRRRSISEAEAAEPSCAAEPGEYVELSVSDTGEGMPPDVIEHLFEPFFTTKDIGSGTGLGLSTVYGIVRQSKGHILVESQVGAGSTFRVLLPAASEEVPTRPSPPPTSSPSPRNETILLAEDDAAVRQTAKRILVRAGHQVIEAENGEEALELLERYSGAIHLVLTDVVMPKMGGLELVGQLRARHPDISVIVMSGYATDALDGELRGLEATFVTKPFTVEQITRAVRNELDR